MSRRKRQEGHTLLELLLVLSIIGVLFTLLLPGVNRLYQRFELDAAGRTVTADLREAQVSAWAHGDDHEIKFTRFTPKYTLWETGVFQEQKRLPERVNYRLGYVENSVSALLFSPGRTTGSGSIRLINATGHQADIKISPVSGHVVYEGVQP